MLKQFAYGFLFVMGLYMTHSLKEFVAGRHTYRMSIVRMIGVDTSLGDPNSFGASIVFALPFVTAIWNTTKSALHSFLCHQLRLLIVRLHHADRFAVVVYRDAGLVVDLAMAQQTSIHGLFVGDLCCPHHLPGIAGLLAESL